MSNRSVAVRDHLSKDALSPGPWMPLSCVPELPKIPRTREHTSNACQPNTARRRDRKLELARQNRKIKRQSLTKSITASTLSRNWWWKWLGGNELGIA